MSNFEETFKALLLEFLHKGKFGDLLDELVRIADDMEAQ